MRRAYLPRIALFELAHIGMKRDRVEHHGVEDRAGRVLIDHDLFPATDRLRLVVDEANLIRVAPAALDRQLRVVLDNTGDELRFDERHLLYQADGFSDAVDSYFEPRVSVVLPPDVAIRRGTRRCTYW